MIAAVIGIALIFVFGIALLFIYLLAAEHHERWLNPGWSEEDEKESRSNN